MSFAGFGVVGAGLVGTLSGTTLATSAEPAVGRPDDPWAYQLHPMAWVVVATIAVTYAAALLVRPSASRPKPTMRQWACLVGGLFSLTVALTWPVADLAEHWSLTALLAQRLLLTLSAAPLLLLAVPAPVLARLTRPAPIDAALDFFTRPVVAVAAFTVIAVGTLASPVVAAQSSTGLARAGIDSLLLFGGMVLWGPVLRHIPGAHRPGPLGLAVYLFVQSIVPTFPAVIFIFARHPLYPAFSAARRAIGVSALADQEISGIVAKIATIPVLWTVAWIALARGQSADRDGRDVEPLTWAEVERQLERASRSELRERTRPRRQRMRAIPRPVPGEGWSSYGGVPTIVEPPHPDDAPSSDT